MKKLLTILLFSMLTLGLSAQGDYASLWKQCENAHKKDQPKTALSAAKKIEDSLLARGYDVKNIGSPKGFKDYNEWLVAKKEMAKGEIYHPEQELVR